MYRRGSQIESDRQFQHTSVVKSPWILHVSHDTKAKPQIRFRVVVGKARLLSAAKKLIHHAIFEWI